MEALGVGPEALGGPGPGRLGCQFTTVMKAVLGSRMQETGTVVKKNNNKPPALWLCALWHLGGPDTSRPVSVSTVTDAA